MNRTVAICARVLVGWLVVVALVLLLRASGFLQAGSLALFDSFSLAAADSAPSAEIAIVGIDDRDFERWGMPPFADSTHVEVFQAVFAGEPALVSWAALKSYPVGEGHEALDALARSRPNWWLAMVPAIGQFDYIPALPAFEEAGRTGHILQHVDLDNVVRRMPVLIEPEEGPRREFLAYRAALEYLRLRGEFGIPLKVDAEGALIVGAESFPQRESGGFGEYVASEDGDDLRTLLLPAIRKPAPPVYSARDLVEGVVDPGVLKGKLVVVGLTSRQLVRPFMTTLSRRWFDSPEWMGPAELHARQIESVLALARGQARPFSAPELWQSISGLALFGLLLMAALVRAPRLFHWCALSLGAAVLVLAVGYAAHLRFYWLPVLPALTIALGLWIWRVGLGLQDGARDRERTRLLQRIIDALPDPMLVIDAHGQLCFDNPAFRRLRLHQDQFHLQATSAGHARLQLPMGEAALALETLGAFRLCRLIEYRRRPAPHADCEVWLKLLGAAAPALDHGAGLRLALIEYATPAGESDETRLGAVAEAALDARLEGRFSDDVLVSIGAGRWLLLRSAEADPVEEQLQQALSWPVLVGGEMWQPKLRFAEVVLPAGARPRVKDADGLQAGLCDVVPAERSARSGSMEAFEALKQKLIKTPSDTAPGTDPE